VPADPFATAELRRRVLAAWLASPARFRADANLEDDHVLVGYRDRVIIELAQNAADAATRAGVPGRLVLTLTADTLTAANSGAPLDSAGVESMSVARASAKADQPDAVGRFGVGFAAVLAVSDAPLAVSSLGAVRWSRPAATKLVATLPELAPQLLERDGRVPVLRLPFAAEAPLPMDADTVIELPLRDAAAVAAVRDQLAALDATLLFALPALAEVVIRVDGAADRVLRAEVHGPRVTTYDGDGALRWWVARATGPVPPDVLAEPTAQERPPSTWRVTWAVPVDGADRMVALPDSVARVVRAPTAVDDPLTLPAVLVASYPLDVARRRVTPGALADLVTQHAAATLVAALAELPPTPSLLRLVPSGFPDGALDGALLAAVLDCLLDSAWLPVAGDPGAWQRPRDASVVADPLVAALAGVIPGLLPEGWSQPALVALEVARPATADLVEVLTAVDRPPAWWHQLYSALDAAVPAGPERDALGALPVPLADGSLVIGPRGVALPDSDLTGVDLAAIGVRLAHPGAAHPLLRALGAVDGTPRALLEAPQVRSAVEAAADEDDPGPVAVAVLTLLRAAGTDNDELPWLDELVLPDAAGQWRPAGELLLPDGRMAQVVASDSGFTTVSPEWLHNWGVQTLMAAGVLDGPAILRVLDATGPSEDLDRESQWWARLPAGAAVTELLAVRDLEQVRPDLLPDLLATLAAPPYRDAIVEPAVVTDGDRTHRVTSYTAWWLSTQPVLAGLEENLSAPTALRLATSDSSLAGLYDVACSDLDEQFLAAIGVVASLDDLDPDELLARLGDDRRSVSRHSLRVLYDALAGTSPGLPVRVRGLRHGSVVVADAADAVILDAPDLVGLLGNLVVVPVAAAKAMLLAESLDLPLASELAGFEVASTGVPTDDAVVHDPLRVVDVDGCPQAVDWRLADGTLHVDAARRAYGLGRGRAWRDGEWAQRHRRTEALTDPDRGRLLDAEDDFDNVN
jgi:hypothetical protein